MLNDIEKAAHRIWAGMTRLRRLAVSNDTPESVAELLRVYYSHIPETVDHSHAMAAYLINWSQQERV